METTWRILFGRIYWKKKKLQWVCDHLKNWQVYQLDEGMGKEERDIGRERGKQGGGKEDMPQEERQEKSKDSLGVEGCQERDSAHRDDCPSLRALQSTRRSASFSDYLYFKHRDEGLKELLERKMEKQAVLLGI